MPNGWEITSSAKTLLLKDRKDVNSYQQKFFHQSNSSLMDNIFASVVFNFLMAMTHSPSWLTCIHLLDMNVALLHLTVFLDWCKQILLINDRTAKQLLRLGASTTAKKNGKTGIWLGVAFKMAAHTLPTDLSCLCALSIFAGDGITNCFEHRQGITLTAPSQCTIASKNHHKKCSSNFWLSPHLVAREKHARVRWRGNPARSHTLVVWRMSGHP